MTGEQTSSATEEFTSAFVDRFYELYEDRMPLYQMSLVRTRDALLAVSHDRASSTAAEQRRVRVEPGRIKEANRLLIKAQSQRYAGKIATPEDIFDQITDIAGTRVTCNTFEDVRRIESGVLRAQHLPLLSKVSASRAHEDYLLVPKESGYRAVHVLVEMQVPKGNSTVTIPCEIQIRTLLQHAWGELTHEDTFKPEMVVPDLVVALSKRLATALAVLDEIAQDLRDELNKIEKEPAPVELLDQRALPPGPSFPIPLFRAEYEQVFGRTLVDSDQKLRPVSTALGSRGIVDADALRPHLEDLRDACKTAFTTWGVLMPDGETIRSLKDALRTGSSARDLLLAVAEARRGEEDAVALYLEKYPRGSMHTGTVVRVTPRYAIAQLRGGAQAIVSARHYEIGRKRIDLQDILRPGEALRVEIVSADPASKRIEAHPVLPPMQ